MNIKNHIAILGKPVEDKITKASGIATSVCFDLYGCIQVSIDRGLDKDGKRFEQHWFDICRLRVTDETPVMELPDFDSGKQAEGKQGAADKPCARA